MATNISPVNYDIKSFTLVAGIETAVQLENAVVLRYIKLQCTTAADIYVSFTSGGCSSVDNRWIIKSGESLELEDIAYPLKESGRFCYAMGGTGTILQVIYAQG